MSQRKLKTLTVREKLNIIQAVNEGNKKKKVIAANFGIPSSTLSTILKNAAELRRLADQGRFLCKRKRYAEYPDVEEYMIKFVKQCRDENISLGGPLLRKKAAEFARALGHECFNASNGWLENFKKRHNIVFKYINDPSASVNEEWKEYPSTSTADEVPNCPDLSSITVEGDESSADVKTPLPEDLEEEYPSTSTADEVPNCPDLSSITVEGDESSGDEKTLPGDLEEPPVYSVHAPSISSSYVEPSRQRRKLSSYTPIAKDLLEKASCYLETEDDDCLTLAKAYATKLRKLTPRQLMFADKVINDALLDAQMGLLTKNTFLVHSAPSPTSHPSSWTSHFMNPS